MASKSYLIVCGEGNSDQLRNPLQSAVSPHIEGQISDFNLPQGAQTPKYGSFDNLMKLSDELSKHDSSTEGCLRRIERQYVETSESELDDSNFEVIQGTGISMSVDAFLKQGWSWDEAKYPAQRSLQQNLDHLLETVQQLDEEGRTAGQAYADIKGQKTALTKQKDNVTFPTRDLVDLLTPAVVNKGDFVYSEHLTTVVVILARGQDVDFMKFYENPSFETIRMKDGKEEKITDRIEPPQTVIPDSAHRFTFPEGAEDKDGNTVWRVVLFKSCKERFLSLARQNKFLVRDFEYSESALGEAGEKRESVEKEAAQQLAKLTLFCKKAWSDIFTAWLHIKAMRAFVESVLRFGSKTKFAASVICPRAGVTPPLRQALAGALKGKEAYFAWDKVDDEGEEYFPYISLGFAPRVPQQAA